MIDSKISNNIKIHDNIYKKYASKHLEIYNSIEQKRLSNAINNASSFIDNSLNDTLALDVGCGSGNLTKHMLSSGMSVTAADVSKKFLSMIEREFSGESVSTALLNGSNLDNLPTETYNFVATYSVLHHIPDYLHTVKEMARVCSIGGIVFIDHECTDEYWSGESAYQAFLKKAQRLDWRKYLVLSHYISKVRRLFDEKFSSEGDIHVWPDDHIEWSKIDSVLFDSGMKRIQNDDYLLFRVNYKKDVYFEYINKCTDMRCRIYKKIR
jgi:ubiquinone/menaquinone biosynthesis C-methylase UbiE